MTKSVVSPELEKHIPDTGIVLILGNKGSGKSVLGHALLYLAKKTGRKAKLHGVPKGRKTTLLPDWITIADSIEPEQDSITLYDESYISFHARAHRSKESQAMSRIAGLVRHYNALAVFITQSVGKLDVSLIRDSDLWLVKEPAPGQTVMDRGEFRPILQKAAKEFAKLPVEKRKTSTYAHSAAGDRMIVDSNGVPSYWKDEVSKMHEGTTHADTNQRRTKSGWRPPRSQGIWVDDIVVVE